MENDLAYFSSNSDELNDFLKSDALMAQNDLISRTYLCFWKGALAGFVTLTTDTIGYNLVEQCDGIEGYVYQKYPAIKIARLAVDIRVWKKSSSGPKNTGWAQVYNPNLSWTIEFTLMVDSTTPAPA